jgi:hypothetical protein
MRVTPSGDQRELARELERLNEAYPDVDIYDLWERLLSGFTKADLLAFIALVCGYLAKNGKGRKVSDLVPNANPAVADLPADEADFEAKRLHQRIRAGTILWFCDHLQYSNHLPLGFPGFAPVVQKAEEPDDIEEVDEVEEAGGEQAVELGLTWEELMNMAVDEGWGAT